MAKTWATKCCSGTYKNNYQLCCGIKVLQKCDMVNIFIVCFHAFDISLRNLFRQLLVLLYIYYYLCHILLEVCNNVEPIK